MDDLAAVEGRLQAILREKGGALIAFSGGVDSTYLLAVAHEVLGERAVAVTAHGLLYPAFETETAIDFCKQQGIRHELIEIDQLADESVAANTPERCYLCKRILMSKLREMAIELGLSAVLEGTNADDASDFRPGEKAVREFDVHSPLREVGLTKAAIRELSRRRGLPAWERMSCACYASRFPYRTTIRKEMVAQVAQVEDELRRSGFRVYRARHFGEEVRLELLPDQMNKLSDDDLRNRLLRVAQEAGYRIMTLDLAGYRTGSLNEALTEELKLKWKSEP